MAIMISREISKLQNNVCFDEHITVPTTQQKFLTNTQNQSRFISVLKEKFTAENILVKQANDYGDVLIDITHCSDSEITIFFLKPGKAQHQSEMCSSQSLSMKVSK